MIKRQGKGKLEMGKKIIGPSPVSNEISEDQTKRKNIRVAVEMGKRTTPKNKSSHNNRNWRGGREEVFHPKASSYPC
ncbi:hypothetical protein TNIN_275501 [Trichonephila inaurata madagascariensis]|uniref:Uncharacterized protein n=1 Tax=Trichonephila inaurata madagascariensis TaxID=2747483 RepID=A0A8X6I738_9ARAC|nr:hypothetical protein TNIN_275501 [Trichonephila inaurata madagascariensis]